MAKMSEKPKGVILDMQTLGDIKLPSGLENMCDWEIHDVIDPDKAKEIVKDKLIVLTNKIPLNKSNLKGSSVKYIGVLATGTNVIDLDFCTDNNIEVKNAVGYSTDSVAQHTFTMLFSFLYKAAYFDDYVKTSKYATSPMFTHLKYEYPEIKGKKWGIIGLGNIGKRVAEIATVFGSEVSYYSTSNISRSDRYQMKDLETLLTESDVISIHAPLNDKTQNLIDRESLEKINRNAVLINVGRGGIVNENDLITALNNNQLKGACLDVFEEEPFDFVDKYRLLKSPEKLMLSPHIAWASIEARQKLLDITEENLQLWINK